MIKKYLYYFIKKSSERAHRAYYTDYYKEYVARCEASPERKPAAVMRREMKALQKYWGCQPYQYYRYKLWHRECPLTIEQMKSYLPDFFAYYLFFPISFRERNVLCEDKRLMSSINEGLGIAQPREVFNTRDGNYFDARLNPLTLEGVRQCIDASSAAQLFAKPTFGVGGKGIRIFERQGDTYVDCTTHEPLDAKVITALAAEDYVVQEGLVQHPLLNAIYPHAVNTFRMVTECDGKGNARVIMSLLRMGSGGIRLDNASLGGIYLRVDPETGVLGKSALRTDNSEVTIHPDTGFRFEGYQIPVWEELKEFACSVALKYRELRYVGWDVAYTVDGPAIIEGNNGPGVSILQDHYGGLREILGIDNPRKYWFREDYTLKNI